MRSPSENECKSENEHVPKGRLEKNTDDIQKGPWSHSEPRRDEVSHSGQMLERRRNCSTARSPTSFLKEDGHSTGRYGSKTVYSVSSEHVWSIYYLRVLLGPGGSEISRGSWSEGQ